MADTSRTLAALQALLADNTTGEISPADVRDFLVSLFALTTKGDILGIDGSGIITRLAAGGDTEVLTLDSGETTGLKWAAAGGHSEAHTAASHSDQEATGAELETLTDGSNADALHAHAAGSGSMTTVKEGGSQVGGADIVTLDFGDGFDIAETPDTEINVTLDLSEIASGGELGGNMDAPTVDATHSGSAHHSNANDHAEAHGTAEHTEGTAWRVTYQDASGDDVELILGADGTFLQSNGASAAPTFGALVQTDVPGHGAAEHTEHGNWKVVYTDASGDETELALGADGTFLQANGAAAAPTFAALVQTDIAGHGIAQHTEHANWKVVYTDGSGDEQELALGADGTFLQSGGASTLPEFTALADGDIPATHSGSPHHDEAHEPESHNSTDITGAELETLSDGSNADALHDHDIIQDDDGDTKIQVEEAADEDIIRFDTAGTEVLVISDPAAGAGVFGGTAHQLHLKMLADYDILIDGATNERTIDTGVMRFEQKPAIPETRCLTLNVDANNHPGTHAQVINLIANLISAGEIINAFSINLIAGSSDGGHADALEVSLVGTGGIDGTAVHANPGVAPLHHDSGSFINVESAWENAAELTTEFNASGNNAELWSANADVVTLGMAAAFDHIEVILATPASGAGIKPVFAFSISGGSGWTDFTPNDETMGMRESGIISWTISDLSSWAATDDNSVTKFWIRITRNIVGLSTPPVEDTIQVQTVTSYGWDKDGKATVNEVSTDTISERTSDAGVTVDGLTIKDSKIDAGDVTYTPAVLTDWDADADPGDTDDALDQLAERIDDTEALEHAESHSVASHNDTTGTGAELETLTDGSDADALHNHPSDLTPAEHTSIGDGSPHHTEYTDNDAISAVEGESTLDLGGDVTVADAKGLVIGHTSQITAAGLAELQVLGVNGNIDAAMIIGHFAANAASGHLDFVKSRHGTVGENTIVLDNDTIGGLRFFPADGADFATEAAQFRVNVDDASPEAGFVGAKYVWFQMPGGNGNAIRETMGLSAAAQLSLPIAGINAGLLLGGDAALYRSNADELRTPDALIVDGDLSATSGDVDGAVTDASTTAKGKVELATAAETKAMASSTLAVTPVSLVAAMEVPVEIKIPLADPIISAADSTLTPAYEYKKPWTDAVRRMGAWSVKFESVVGGDVTFKLQKNGSDVAGSTLTIANGTAESGTTPFPPESFTEFTLAANDVLTVVQTTSRTDAIQAVATIYGYERVVPAGDTL